MNLQFIDLGGHPHRQDTSTRRKVRSHVMRRYKRETRTVQDQRSNIANNPETPGTNFSYEWVGNAIECDQDMTSSTTSLDPIRLVDVGSVSSIDEFDSRDAPDLDPVPSALLALQPLQTNNGDPFDILPVPSSTRISMLLYQRT